MQIRMAMDKLKQALGMQITDDQLMALMRRDMAAADPGGEAYGSQRSQPIFGDLAEYPADEIAEAMQAGQGSLTASQPREGIALLAEMMADQELAEQVNQALLEKERMG